MAVVKLAWIVATGTSRNRWRAAFLLVTVLAIVMELIAAFDGRQDTDPWTSLLVLYVPEPVVMAAIGVLVLWLLGHFAVRYARRRAAQRRAAAQRSEGPTSGQI